MIDGLFEVDDLDPASFPEDEPFHLGVPTFGLMTEMHTSFQQPLDQFIYHLNLHCLCHLWGNRQVNISVLRF